MKANFPWMLKQSQTGAKTDSVLQGHGHINDIIIRLTRANIPQENQI